MITNRILGGMVAMLLLGAAPSRAEGFITPFIGYNFGGDSGNCPSLTNCTEKRTNVGVSIGSMGPVLGIEEDVSFARHFFGDTPETDNSVFSAMTNVLLGIGVGPARPYVLGGLGLIRPHVSAVGFGASKNAFGYDVGGGLTVSVAPHVGVRGDLRHLHTLANVDLPFFSSEHLNFWRGSAGLTIRF
jgi:opacity protein-like surface antigen